MQCQTNSAECMGKLKANNHFKINQARIFSLPKNGAITTVPCE